jgi:hypothetical protein
MDAQSLGGITHALPFCIIRRSPPPPRQRAGAGTRSLRGSAAPRGDDRPRPLSWVAAAHVRTALPPWRGAPAWGCGAPAAGYLTPPAPCGHWATSVALSNAAELGLVL